MARNRLFTLFGVTLAVGVGLVLACSTDRPVGPPPAVSNVGRTPAEQAVRQRLSWLARQVARALRDPALRAEVYQAIQESPYTEHKLHFRTYLQGGGGRLLGAMAASEQGLTHSAVLATLDSVVDLEFYMPVPEHRARWQGDENLIVATALQDHEIPVAFDLNGAPVRLESAEVPPETPTLGLVPVETDFSVRPQLAMACADPEACEGGGGGGGDGGGGTTELPPSKIVMTYSYIPDDYEGFLKGNPEFEIHVFGRRTAGDTGVYDLQCVGNEAATSPNQPGIKSPEYVYNQDAPIWGGQVTLMTARQLQVAQSLDSSLAYWVWEDDSEPCLIRKPPDSIWDYFIRIANVLRNHQNALKPIVTGNSRQITLGQILKLIGAIFGALNNDDVVGLIVAESEVGVDFTDATHVIVHAQNGSPLVRGRVKLRLDP